jgi:protein-S-isoprenylcysteine O-methyltransferase Ste14
MTILSGLTKQLDDSALACSPMSAKTNSFWQKFRATKAYDLLAALPLILWYGLSAGQQVPGLARKIAAMKLADLDLHFAVALLAQLATFIVLVTMLIFLLIRMPPKAKAKGLIPSIIAIAGTSFAIAIVWLPQVQLGTTLSLLSLFLIMIGLSFSTYTMLYLGRSFSVMPQARSLVMSGPYAIIRHPLYLGEGLAIAGVMLQYLSPLAIVIVGLQFAFQLQRMNNEERVLAGQFPEYQDYMARTSRIIPGVY